MYEFLLNVEPSVERAERLFGPGVKCVRNRETRAAKLLRCVGTIRLRRHDRWTFHFLKSPRIHCDRQGFDREMQLQLNGQKMIES